MPMPIEGMTMTIEPRYPYAEGLAALNRPEIAEDDLRSKQKVRNIFWSWRWRAPVAIWEENGKIQWGPLGNSHGPTKALDTLKAADAWGVEQEARAVDTLGRLLRHRQFKQYLLTGMFMEQSRRSGVHYLFRRLRPTVAFGSSASDGLKILCALCMHPIGYYDGSWAGVMTPTDDVVAHLMLMRGDEHMFWRRCNQHPAYDHSAGL